MIFATCPSDVTEQRCRGKLIQYAISHPIKLCTKFLPANSRTLRGNCSCWTRACQGCSNLLTPFRVMELYLSSLKIYKKLSLIIRFVCNITPFSILTKVIDCATKGNL